MSEAHALQHEHPSERLAGNDDNTRQGHALSDDDNDDGLGADTTADQHRASSRRRPDASSANEDSGNAGSAIDAGECRHGGRAMPTNPAANPRDPGSAAPIPTAAIGQQARLSCDW